MLGKVTVDVLEDVAPGYQQWVRGEEVVAKDRVAPRPKVPANEVEQCDVLQVGRTRDDPLLWFAIVATRLCDERLEVARALGPDFIRRSAMRIRRSQQGVQVDGCRESPVVGAEEAELEGDCLLEMGEHFRPLEEGRRTIDIRGIRAGHHGQWVDLNRRGAGRDLLVRDPLDVAGVKAIEVDRLLCSSRPRFVWRNQDLAVLGEHLVSHHKASAAFGRPPTWRMARARFDTRLPLEITSVTISTSSPSKFSTP